jgi:hypothetical protein
VLIVLCFLLCSVDLVRDEFGRNYTVLSEAFRYFMIHCHVTHLRKLTDNIAYWLPHMPGYAEVIRRKLLTLGVPFAEDNFCVFSFIDDVNIRVCRVGGGPVAPGGPGAARNAYLMQESFWNGWLRMHGLKWQVWCVYLLLYCFLLSYILFYYYCIVIVRQFTFPTA